MKKIIISLILLILSPLILGNFDKVYAISSTSFNPAGVTITPASPNFTAKIFVNAPGVTIRGYQIYVQFDPSKAHVTGITYLEGRRSANLGSEIGVSGGDETTNAADINARNPGVIYLFGEIANTAGDTLGATYKEFADIDFTSVNQQPTEIKVNVTNPAITSFLWENTTLDKLNLSSSTFTVSVPISTPTPTPLPSTPTPTPTPRGGTGPLACTRFELSGLTKSSAKNPEGGPIYTAAPQGSNNPFDLVFTPKSATATLTATTQITGAPDMTITETNVGSNIVRVANIPSNTSDTQDNSYLIRATIDDSIASVSCLPIQVIVPKVGTGPGPTSTPTTCPADINSSEVKFKNADNTGAWIKDRTITLGQSVRVGGFHNGQTPDTPPADVELGYVGPKGVTSPPATNGGIFTPSSDPNVGPGAYVFTATTVGKTGAKCSGTATLVVNAAPTPPAPVKKTLCFAIGEGPAGKTAVDAVADCSNIDNKLVFPYDSEPFKITGFTFKDQTPGIKTIFVKFIGLLGSATVTDSRQLSIRFTPNPTISNASCTHSSSGTGTDIKIIGTSFGAQGKGKVKVGNQEITPDSWDGTSNTISGKVAQRLEGKILIEIVVDDGRVAKGECTVNTTTVTFKTLLACKQAGSFAASNVDVKVFEAVPLTTDTQAPEPLLKQKISLNKDGEPQNFAPKFEKKKKYQLIIKAPGTIARRVDFDTKDGGTTNLEGAISLPQGDIAPANSPDGKINALDKSELIRQWNIVTDVAKTADLNGDSRVNSIDYACMRINFNATDDTYSAPSVTPSPTPAISASPTPTPTLPPVSGPITPPGGGTGGTLFRVSFDPTFAALAGSGTVDPVTGEKIIDLTLPPGAGVKSVYVQFSEDGGVSWGPTPPSVATITLL